MSNPYSHPSTNVPNQQYAAIQDAIKAGHVKHLADLLTYLSESELATVLDMEEDDLPLLLEDPELISVKKLVKLSHLFNIKDIHFLMEALTGRSNH